MKKPLVTIGMPLFNGEKYLKEAIDSLLAQTYENFEIIISDDGSTDSTIKIIKSYDDDRIRVLDQKKRFGMVGNYENLVKNVKKGEYFFFADQDDIWLPNFIEKCLKKFSENEHIDAVCVQTESISEDLKNIHFIDKGLRIFDESPTKRFVSYRKKLESGTDVGSLYCGIYKSNFIEKLIPFNEVIGFDHIILGKAVLLGRFEVVDEVLLKKRAGGASVSKESLEEAHGGNQINNSLKIYDQREVYMQKMIWSCHSISFFNKLKSSLWSIYDFMKKYKLPYIKQIFLKKRTA